MNLSIQQIEEEIVFDEWRRHRATARRSLSRARLFADELGLTADRRRSIPLIGVVGSKGKGTAALYAAATLAAAGLRVGSVTSPGLLANRDRFRIDGRALSPTRYRDLLSRVGQAKLRLPPVGADGYLSPTGTFTVAGAHTLIEAGCDALVLEAGIGGASDELSLFDPDVAVVGPIFGEHLDLLGPTVLDVARDKLGIVKDRTTAIVTVPQSPEVAAEIDRAAAAHAAEISQVDPGQAGHLAPWLPPGFGTPNALAGIRAAQKLLAATASASATAPRPGDPPENPSEADLVRVLKTVHYPGRLSVHETTATAPPGRGRLILDTAVSRAGLHTALSFAEQTFDGPPDRVLVSLPATKDFEGFLAELGATAGPRIFVELARGHLSYPDRSRWPWRWITEEQLDDDLLAGNVLAVGTVSFVTALMHRLDIDAEQLFVK